MNVTMKVHIKKTLINIGWTDGGGKLIKFFSLKTHTLNNNQNSILIALSLQRCNVKTTLFGVIYHV